MVPPQHTHTNSKRCKSVSGLTGKEKHFTTHILHCCLDSSWFIQKSRVYLARLFPDRKPPSTFCKYNNPAIKSGSVKSTRETRWLKLDRGMMFILLCSPCATFFWKPRGKVGARRAKTDFAGWMWRSGAGFLGTSMFTSGSCFLRFGW